MPGGFGSRGKKLDTFSKIGKYYILKGVRKSKKVDWGENKGKYYIIIPRQRESGQNKEKKRGEK